MALVGPFYLKEYQAEPYPAVILPSGHQLHNHFDSVYTFTSYSIVKEENNVKMEIPNTDLFPTIPPWHHKYIFKRIANLYELAENKASEEIKELNNWLLYLAKEDSLKFAALKITVTEKGVSKKQVNQYLISN